MTVLQKRTSKFILGSPYFFNYNYFMDLNAANINSTAATQTTARPATFQKVLQEGSNVPVRVTRAIGQGRYEGFIAGVKVTFSSARTLNAGAVFTATVSGNGSKIILTPQNQTEGAVLQNLNFQMNEVTSQALINLLETAGLPPDALSSSIFQLFTQTGLKINAQFMNRIRSLALRFGTNQKSAAEILVMLAEKGISADEEEINELLLQLTGELVWNDDADKTSDSQKNHEKLINRLNSKEGAWYLLPFELVQYEGGVLQADAAKNVLGGGNLRLLFDSGKMLKLMNLDCLYGKKRYVFNLGYEGGKCRSVRFNTGENGPDVNHIIEKLKKLFMTADITGLDIRWQELCDIEGNASGLENIYTFGGDV